MSCWRQLADNVAASLVRGDRALVYGRLRQRSFETSEGERRVSYEIDADAVGTELT
ncbi:single-stranded DNA-binding protein, partial [Frankia sp. CpI1-P]